MLKAVGFDLDNTIYLHKDFEFEVYKKISKLVSRKYKIKKEKYFDNLVQLFNNNKQIETFNKAMIKTVCHLPVDWDQFVLEEILQIYRNFKPDLKPDETIINLIKFFNNAGLITVLITNGNSNVQNNKIDALGIRNYFEKIYISDDCNRKARKPALTMFEMFLKDFDVEPSECLYIGDNIETDRICERIGIQFLHFDLQDKQ